MPRRKAPAPRQYHAIKITSEGREYSGSYCVEHGWLYLDTDIGSKKAQPRLTNPKLLARILFKELLVEWRAKSKRNWDTRFRELGH